MIAECIVEISRAMQSAAAHKTQGVKSRAQLKELLLRTASYFAKVIENYNKKGDQSRFVISEFQDFEEAIDKFRNSERMHPKLLWIPVAAEYIKMIIVKIKETEFIMINIENSPKAPAQSTDLA